MAASRRVSLLLLVAFIIVTAAIALPTSSSQQYRSAKEPRSSIMSAQRDHHRVRRQNGEVVESIFQIPIQTLMAVSKVFTTGIQSFNRQREAFYQATSPGNRPVPVSSAALYSSPYSRPPWASSSSSSSASALASAYASLSSRPRSGSSSGSSSAASVAGVGVQEDGSSYRI